MAGMFCSNCGAPLAKGAARALSSPGLSERVGRAAGEVVGHGVRGAVSVAAEPIVDKVWRERPELEPWQKALGIVAWIVLVMQPIGWAFLAGSFITMVLMGRHNPYTWVAWVTRSGAVIVLVAAVLFLLALVTWAAQQPST